MIFISVMQIKISFRILRKELGGCSSVKNKKVLLCISSGVGGGLIGVFAGRLDTVLGCLFFTAGIAILVFSITSMINYT